jgi:YbgC/YbaW family acyl-CoA thioester hydrolase
MTMTRVYRRRYRVRGYEVDATSRVHDGVYLNYIQQAAFEASADVGYDTRRYDALGTIWVIRKQNIVYLAPLGYSDEVELTTWVSDFRRVRSHREYELRRVSNQELVAVAQADWVYIDATTLFPRRIPADAVEKFQANGRRAMDAVPPPEPVKAFDGRAFAYLHHVKGYELDNLRHVNNANYLNWLNQARLDAIADCGFPLDESATHIQGLDVMVSPVRYEIEYFVPAVAGDRIQIRSQVASAGATELTWIHEIRRGEERLVEARATVRFEAVNGGVASVPSKLLEAVAH